MSTKITITHKPSICPVCEGRGHVQNSFYTGASHTSSLSPEQCRSCGGIGTILSKVEEVYSDIFEFERKILLTHKHIIN